MVSWMPPKRIKNGMGFTETLAKEKSLCERGRPFEPAVSWGPSAVREIVLYSYVSALVNAQNLVIFIPLTVCRVHSKVLTGSDNYPV
jgi:hypothetical protein